MSSVILACFWRGSRTFPVHWIHDNHLISPDCRQRAGLLERSQSGHERTFDRLSDCAYSIAEVNIVSVGEGGAEPDIKVYVSLYQTYTMICWVTNQ